MRSFPVVLAAVALLLALPLGGYISPPYSAEINETWLSTLSGDVVGGAALLGYLPLGDLAQRVLQKEPIDWDAIQEVIRTRLPGPLRLIMSQSAELIREISANLEAANAALDEADGQILARQLSEAATSLDRADAPIEAAAGGLSRLRLVANRLDRLFKDPTGLLHLAAKERFSTYVRSLDEVRERYRLRTAELRLAYEQAQTAEATSLTIAPAHVLVRADEPFTLGGSLTSASGRLADRVIELLRDGGSVAKTVTDADGGYEFRLSARPHTQATSMMLARYVPDETDRSLYRASAAAAEVRFLAQPSRLGLDVSEAYPGKPLDLSINVSSSRPRDIELSLDGSRAGLVSCDRTCSWSTTLPPTIALGPHRLTASAGDDPEYLLISREVVFPVSRVTPRITAAIVPWLLLPGEATVQGTLESPLGFAPGSRIAVRQVGPSPVSVAGDGNPFDVRIEVPDQLTVPVSRRGAFLEYLPAESWHEAVRLPLVFVAISPLSSIPPAIAVLALLAGARRLRPRLTESPQPDGSSVAAAPPSAAAQPLGNENIAAIVLGLYRWAASLLEHALGVRQQPSHTLREFTAVVTRQLPRLHDPLFRLTELAERARYSSASPTRVAAVEAEVIGDRIWHELQLPHD